MTKVWKPSNTIVVVNSIPVQGFASGTMVTIEWNSEKFSQVVGAGGDVTTVESEDKSGTITINLKQDSPTRKAFDSLWANGLIFSALVKNTNPGPARGAGYKGQSCFMERPSEEMAEEVGGIEYTVKAQRLMPLNMVTS